MNNNQYQLVVVGHGEAGLAAAVTCAENSAKNDASSRIASLNASVSDDKFGWRTRDGKHTIGFNVPSPTGPCRWTRAHSSVTRSPESFPSASAASALTSTLES